MKLKYWMAYRKIFVQLNPFTALMVIISLVLLIKQNQENWVLFTAPIEPVLFLNWISKATMVLWLIIFHIELAYQVLHFCFQEELSSDDYSVKSPRFSPDGKTLVWLQRKAGGPHGACMKLLRADVPLSKDVSIYPNNLPSKLIA